MFRRRLFITFTVTFCLFLFLYSFIFLKEEIRLVHTRIKEKGEKIIEGLLHPARFFLLAGDSSVFNIAQEYMEDADVISIAIFDVYKRPIFILGDIMPVKDRDFASLSPMLRKEKGYIFINSITIPFGGLFEEGKEKVLGYIGVFISDASFRRTISTFIGELTFFLLLFACIGLLLSHLLSLRLTRNIDELLKGVEEIEKGRFDRRIEIKGESELVRLAENFNRMAESLKNRIEEVEKLNQELKEKTKKLNEAYQKIVVSEKAKSEFFESISHEFRTPLQIIGGFTELLLKEKLSKSTREKLDRIRRNVDRLSYLIDSVLSIKSHSPEDYKDVDMRDIVKEVIFEVEKKMPELKMDVEIEIGEIPKIRVVPDEMKKAFEAIVMNEISSRTDVLRIYGGRKDDEIEIVFENSGGKESLGLSIARMIVEAHGGRFEIEGNRIRVVFEV